MLNHVPSVPKCLCAGVVYMPTCLFMCQQGCLATCQKRANFSFSRAIQRANVWTPTCQTVWQFFKHSSFEMLQKMSKKRLYKNYKNATLHLILWLYISYVYDASYIKIVLDFFSILHLIVKKRVWNFAFFIIFSFLVI